MTSIYYLWGYTYNKRDPVLIRSFLKHSEIDTYFKLNESELKYKYMLFKIEERLKYSWQKIFYPVK